MKQAPRITQKYMRSLDALYGNGKILTSRTSSKITVPTELQEQIKLCRWMDENNILYYAIPNGGSRNMLEAVNLKRSGTKRGVPDICVPVAKKPYHGLYIELKRVKNSTTSEEQMGWIDRLNQEGYFAKVCFGYEEAHKVVQNYLNEKDVF